MSKTLIIMRSAETDASRGGLTEDAAHRVENVTQQILVDGFPVEAVVHNLDLGAVVTAREAYTALTGRGFSPGNASIGFDTEKGKRAVSDLDRIVQSADTALMIVDDKAATHLVREFTGAIAGLKRPGDTARLESNAAQSWGEFAASGKQGKALKVYR